MRNTSRQHQLPPLARYLHVAVPQKLTNIAVPVRKQHTAVKAMVQPS
jgi:hypothetical protein